MNETEIKQLSKTERLQILDTVWNSLLEEKSELDSPDWHAEILEERRKKIDEGKAKFMTLDELKNQRRK